MEKFPLIIFMFYTLPASVIPLIIGSIILIISRRDTLIVLAGLFTLKSVVEGFISFWVMENGIGYNYGIPGVVAFGMLSPILISIVLLFAFRQTINRSGRTFLMLFGLDTIRWLISSIFPWWFGVSWEGFASIWYLALCFEMLFPSIYAVIVLVIVLERKKMSTKPKRLTANI